jgi:small-conductance mechanosensitive channel
MIRSAVFIVAAFALAGPEVWSQCASAQGAPTESDDSRYTFNRADDGYLRLDGRTGQVSICTRRPVGWACQAAPDERTALESEIARLQGENVSLKKELIARNVPLPGMVKPEPPAAKTEEPRLQLPSDAELNKMMTFVEKVWRRLVEMILTMQRDMLNKKT